MIERWRSRVVEGMLVKSADGEKLGKVVSCQPGGLVVEKGFFFPRDAMVPYDRIADVRNGEIVLSLARPELGDLGARPMEGAKEAIKNAMSDAKAALTGEEVGRHVTLDRFGEGGEIRVPLVEEEIVAKKHVERVGEVHVRKEIITEEKQITVPVTREVIRVERVTVNQDAKPGERIFEKEEFDIPISEEHITVEKRSVVREELRIGKEVQQGEETARATLRREHAEVETRGSVRRAEGPSKMGPEMRAAAPKR